MVCARGKVIGAARDHIRERDVVRATIAQHGLDVVDRDGVVAQREGQRIGAGAQVEGGARNAGAQCYQIIAGAAGQALGAG